MAGTAAAALGDAFLPRLDLQYSKILKVAI
jgi:hypothetical protein